MKLLVGAFAAVCFGFPTPSLADAAVSTAGWSELSISLADLDSTDGVSPWFQPTSRAWCLGEFGQWPSLPCGEHSVDNGFRLPMASSSTLAMHPLSFGYPWFGQTQVETLHFNLSPNTRLTVTGRLYSESSAAVNEHIDYGDGYFLFGSAGTWAEAAVSTGNGDLVRVSSSFSDPRANDTSFSLSLISGDVGLASWMRLDLIVQGYSHQTWIVPPPPPVPEPSTYALALVGLATMIWMRRRSEQANESGSGSKEK